MGKPTKEEMLDEVGVKQVHREADDSYRHGSYVFEVFHREGDDTYWGASYTLSNDCEEHGLRDGEYDLSRVMPVVREITDFVAYKEPDAVE